MKSKVCKKCSVRYYRDKDGLAYTLNKVTEPTYYLNGKSTLKINKGKTIFDKYEELKFCSSNWYNSKKDINQQSNGNIVGYSFRPRGRFNIYTKKG